MGAGRAPDGLVYVQVTRDHIAKGKRSDDEECAVALAITEATGREGWSVSAYTAELYNERNQREYNCPLIAQVTRWVADFYEGKPVRPISFYMDLR